MPGLNQGTSPNVGKTALDTLFFQEYNKATQPNFTTAEDSRIFNQISVDGSDWVSEVMEPVGNFADTVEQANYKEDSVRAGDKKTTHISKFTNSIAISEEMIADGKFDIIGKSVKSLAHAGYRTREKNAFSMLPKMFSSVLTNDGAAAISTSHTTLNGDTVSNMGTAALTEGSLFTGINTMIEMENQKGEVEGDQPAILVVAPALWKKAIEITKSELISDSANNNVNFFSSTLSLYVITSPFLGAAGSGVSGADAMWYLLSGNHSINRLVRKAMTTDMVEGKYQANGDSIYKAMFREAYEVTSYEGLYGSNGTT